MTHATLELLSGYLDAELGPGERVEVEDHLADCPDCRERLDGLRRVVGRLRRLERAAPPGWLAEGVERRVALAARRQGWMDRLETQLRRSSWQPTTLVVFALVLALASMVYLLSHGVARQVGSGTSLVVPPAGSEEAGVRRLAGRVFEHGEGVWRERGLPAGAPVVTVDPSVEEGRDRLASEADLAVLVRLGGPVLVAVDGEVWRIDFPASGSPP